jgi:3-hydroxybutyryl-CoA dehydrogenase
MKAKSIWLSLRNFKKNRMECAKMENIPQNITIVGSGTQGSMLAFRSAVYGRRVCIFDLSEDATKKALMKVKIWFDEWVSKGKITSDAATSSFSSITTASNLKEALVDADLVIENVPEILHLSKKSGLK